MSVLIEIQIGDPVQERHKLYRRGKVSDIKISPNGVLNPELIALLVVDLDDGGKVIATADKFVTVPDHKYTECYPSRLL